MAQTRLRVGIVGYGHIGQYLTDTILNDTVVSKKFELSFVWNRSIEKIQEKGLVDPSKQLVNLDEFDTFNTDLIVEVAHPSIIQRYGERFLKHCSLFIGSPTALADSNTERILHTLARENTLGHGLYIPSGALWGAADIQKMAVRNSLQGLTITMKKHPSSLRLTGELHDKLEKILETKPQGEILLYEGPVRQLCPLAPNNVNTMAAAAIAGHSLGFDGTKCKLICDFALDAHIIDIEVLGPGSTPTQRFSVKTTRYNPAAAGAVTGNATYESFLASLLSSGRLGGGIHMV